MRLCYKTYKNNESPKKALVFIHGWGGNKNSFSPFVSRLKFNTHIEWFFPEAPYDLNDHKIDGIKSTPSKKSWTFKKQDNQWETEEPMKMLDNFFSQEIFNCYKSENVFVFGFSQGAAICYEHIMGMDVKFGGIFPIAGFFFEKTSRKKVSIRNRQTPIIIGHGINDLIVPIEKSEEAYRKLVGENANVTIEKYNGGHKINMKYIKKIIRMIDE